LATHRCAIRSSLDTNVPASVDGPMEIYLIFYRVSDEGVEILHVLHGARDYEAILFPDG
jgi:plasmid stabilization system protein ParE